MRKSLLLVEICFGGSLISRTTGLGVLVLGIVLIGGQFILSMGERGAVQSVAGESHPKPTVRDVPPILGVFGVIALIAGIPMAMFGRTGKNGSQRGDHRLLLPVRGSPQNCPRPNLYLREEKKESGFAQSGFAQGYPSSPSAWVSVQEYYRAGQVYGP